MTIQRRTLEVIAKYIGEKTTGTELVKLLEDCRVPKHLIVYPNTKWKMLYDAMHTLSNSKNSDDSQTLFRVISSLLHPLTFGGDESESRKAVNKFNECLKYDEIRLHLMGDGHIGWGTTKEMSKQDQQVVIESIEQDTSIAVQIIKTQLPNTLSLLKKGYQLLINIVETYFADISSPDENLNTSYLKISKIVDCSQKTIFNHIENQEMPLDFSLPAREIFLPFRNLYGAEIELNGIDDDKKKELKSKMNKCYGDIVELALLCEASDILDKSQTQKLFNNVELYLSELKEKKGESTVDEQTITHEIKGLSFDEVESIIHIIGKTVKIPHGTNQYYLCRAIFRKPKKRWENDELLENFGSDNQQEKEVKQQPYDAMIAVQKKVNKKTGIEDLILYENKTYRLNMKYMPSAESK
jgi:hypothetical protein